MDKSEQIDIFSNRLDALARSTAAEFTISTATVVGTLIMKAIQITNNAKKEEDDE